MIGRSRSNMVLASGHALWFSEGCVDVVLLFGVFEFIPASNRSIDHVHWRGTAEAGGRRCIQKMEANAKFVSEEHFLEAMTDTEVNVKERKETISKMIGDMLKTEGSVSRAFLNESMKQFTTGEADADRVKGIFDRSNGLAPTDL